MVENKIAWFEGMFLQPQHFQQHDKYLENYIHQKTSIVDMNNWGFTELTLDTELLNIGKIAIISCKGIFEDGTPFNAPRNDALPPPFEIPVGMENSCLYLSIPEKKQGTSELSTETNSGIFRYISKKHEIKDIVEGSDTIATVEMASLSLRIMSKQDDRSRFTCLPITEIIESHPNNQITINKGFVAPYVDAKQCQFLTSSMKEFHGLLKNRSEMLSARLTDTQQAGTAEVVDFMLLQLTNKYEPLFHYFLNKKNIHPESYFQTIIQLCGEIATFTNNKRHTSIVPIYQHRKLEQTFTPIFDELRKALTMVLEQNATAIKLEQNTSGLWTGLLNDKEILKNHHFILAVYGDIPADNIKAIIQSQIKISPIEHIRNLVSRALPGIELNSVAVAPRQIPYHANFSYFSLNQKNPLWEMLANSSGIAIHTGTNIPGLKLELWAIKG